MVNRHRPDPLLLSNNMKQNFKTHPRATWLRNPGSMALIKRHLDHD